MRCHACGWNRKNITNLSFCPTCGSDADLGYYADDASDAMVTCDVCHETYLYWQEGEHWIFACKKLSTELSTGQSA